ncbi:MAG: bb3-type cytochrome oxidase subunit III [Pseudomonadota bacterium]
MNSASAFANPAGLDLAPEQDRRAELSVALWVFMGVATTLFLLFLAAYVMRMNGADWAAITIPWQLNLSSILLICASLSLRQANTAARASQVSGCRLLLQVAGACSLGFLASQLAAWQALVSMQVALAGNPSASFFYLLTAMHGLHVLGGLVIYTLTLRHAWRATDIGKVSWQIALCARYWHFLLAVWLLLFAALSWLTPEWVQAICGTR